MSWSTVSYTVIIIIDSDLWHYSVHNEQYMYMSVYTVVFIIHVFVTVPVVIHTPARAFECISFPSINPIPLSCYKQRRETILRT